MKTITIIFATLLFTNISWAIPIATNVALPVTKGETVYRVQTKSIKPKNMNETYVYPVAFAHGLSGNTVLIGALPYKVTPTTSGLTDIPLTIRYTVYRKDAPLETSRFALLGGIKLPLGSDVFTTESTDWRLGGVYTYQNNRHEIDASLVYSINTEAQGVEKGDTIAHDLAYQFRLFPGSYGESGVPSQLNLDIEFNGIYIGKDEILGLRDNSTGSYKLFLSPGLQWVTQNYIIEGLAQFPIVQNLNASQNKEDFRLILGVRFQI